MTSTAPTPPARHTQGKMDITCFHGGQAWGGSSGIFEIGTGEPGKTRHVASVCAPLGAPHDEKEANSERFVAVWNACDGIPTVALEQGVVRELLDACRFTLDLLDHLSAHDYARGGDRPAREKLLAAIQKALPPG